MTDVAGRRAGPRRGRRAGPLRGGRKRVDCPPCRRPALAPSPSSSWSGWGAPRIAEAFRHPVDGGWRSLTWAETEARVRAVASGLRGLGVGMEDVCAILSGTRLEWVLADFGILCAGGATSTIYPSSTAGRLRLHPGRLRRGGLLRGGLGRRPASCVGRRAELPRLRHLVVFAGRRLARTASSSPSRRWRPAGTRPTPPTRAPSRRPAPRCGATPWPPSSTPPAPPAGPRAWSSPTTAGWPSRRRWRSRASSSTRSRSQLFWLPLAHSFGKMIGTAQLRIGFPTAVDGRVERLVENLSVVRPTFVCAVPRIFEKVHAKVVATAGEAGGVKRAVFEWAIAVGPPGGGAGARGQGARAVAGGAAAAGRPAGLPEGAGPLRRAAALLHLRLGAALPRGGRVLRRHGDRHPGGLRPDRVLGRHPRQPPLEQHHRLGGAAAPRHGGAAGAEDGEVLMRGPWVMRGYHGLDGGDRRGARRRGLAPHRRRGARRRAGAAHHHRSEAGPHQDLGRQVRGARRAGGAASRPAARYLSQVLIHGDRRNYVTALVHPRPRGARPGWGAAQGLHRAHPGARPRSTWRSRRWCSRRSTSSTPPCPSSPP